ncbi:MAG: DUF1801 domain-containing protein [Myxococcales bacterium]|nr:DUF1801 domain-containing protein [Myxococcales bacterium]
MAQSRDVDAWFDRYDNPMKAVVARVRQIVLAADPRIDECVKWQAPTFVYRGNLASFFPKSRQHASLMFHEGARIPGVHPRLEGDSDRGRVLKIASLAEADAAKRDIERIVRAWCNWRDADEAKTPTAKASRATASPKKPAPKQPAPKKPAPKKPAPKKRAASSSARQTAAKKRT